MLAFVRPCCKYVPLSRWDYMNKEGLMDIYAGTLIEVEVDKRPNFDYYQRDPGWHWKKDDLILYTDENKKMIDECIKNLKRRQNV